MAITSLRFDHDTRALDTALGLLLGGIVLQLVPLPPSVLTWVSPQRARLADLFALDAVPAWAPVTIDPAATVYALAVFLSAVLTFVSCRTLLAHHGVRDVCRAIGWLGLFLACAGMVQRAVSHATIYGFWVPADGGALPFGPFVNRNHAATWLVMGASVSVGYLIARLHTPGPHHRRFASLRQSADSRTLWLAIAGTTMVIGLGVSLSRSGALALATAAATFVASGRTRLRRRGAAWVVIVSVVAGVVLVTLGQFAAILDRVVDTAVSGPPDRFVIWRDTLTAARAFWLTGSGAGTYAQLMLAYQTADRAYYFNQAHNHYLQVVAEGGVLLVVPLAVGLIAFVRAAIARVAEDASGVFWIRVGALAGLAGVAIQSGWETGLRLPANAEMTAVLAALVLHPVSTAEAPRT